MLFFNCDAKIRNNFYLAKNKLLKNDKKHIYK